MTTKRDVIQLGTIYQKRKLATIFDHNVLYRINQKEFSKLPDDYVVDEELANKYKKARDDLKEVMEEDRRFRQRQGIKITLGKQGAGI